MSAAQKRSPSQAHSSRHQSGRTANAMAAAKSHTGAMVGSDRVYDAAFRRAGLVRVDDLEDSV
jgi:acyl-CoA synthetase (NDP forming)